MNQFVRARLEIFIADTRKLEKIFGEKPNMSIKDGLEQTLSWLKAQ